MRSKEARICVFCDRQRERESLNEKERKKERKNAFRFVSFDSAWIFRGINDNIFYTIQKNRCYSIRSNLLHFYEIISIRRRERAGVSMENFTLH